MIDGWGLLDDWKVDVTVLRGGGRDSSGNPRTPTEIRVEGCIISQSETADSSDVGDVQSASGRLFRHDNSFVFLSTDLIRVPANAYLRAGVWRVEGRPRVLPLGTELALEWEGEA